jgi:hypothetical protein
MCERRSECGRAFTNWTATNLGRIHATLWATTCCAARVSSLQRCHPSLPDFARCVLDDLDSGRDQILFFYKRYNNC